MKTTNYYQLRTIAILIALFTTFSFSLNSQSICNNLDFEDGDFTNWRAFTGDMHSIDTIAVEELVPGRHTITSGLVLDPYTNNQIQTVAPGSNYSCRLGNDFVGAQAERLEYTYRVCDTSALFIYQYAVVFEDPGHDIASQPQFEVIVLDSTGHCIDQICGYYQVTAAGEIPGFNAFNGVMYKDWTTVGLDLTNYIGELITISFTTKDCGHGGHFGYAYIDAFYKPMELLIKACAGNDSILLSAPEGFTEYLWMPGNVRAREFKIPTNMAGQEYMCTLTSVNGCQITLSASTELTVINPDFEVESCMNTLFTDLTTIENGEIAGWEWNFNEPGINSNSTLQNPEYYFQEAGIHDVTLTITSTKACQQTITKPAKIYFKPHVDFTFDEVCFGNPTRFANKTMVDFADTIRYVWDFGDGNKLKEINPEYTLIASNSNVRLKAIVGDNCYETASKDVDTKPCQLMIPNVISPNCDSHNEIFYILNLENYPENNLTIFNRWGNIIYETDNYQNNWSPQDNVPGTYYYIFNYPYNSTETAMRTKKGFFEMFADK